MDNDDDDNIGWSLSSLMEYYNPGVANQQNNSDSQSKKKKDSSIINDNSSSNNNNNNNNNNSNSSNNISNSYSYINKKSFGNSDEEDIVKSPNPYSYNNYQPFEEDDQDEIPIYTTPSQLPKVSSKSTTTTNETTTTASSYSTPRSSIESSIPISLPKPVISPTKIPQSLKDKSKSSKDRSKSSKEKSKSSKNKSKSQESISTSTPRISKSNFNQLSNYESPVIKQIKKDFPYIELSKEYLYSDSKVLPSNFTEEYLDHLEDQVDLLWSKIKPKDHEGNEIQLNSSIMKTLVYHSSKQLTDVLDHMFYRASIEREQDIKSFRVLPKDVIESSFVAGVDNQVINNSILNINSILPKDLIVPIDYRFKCNEKFLDQDKEIKRKLQIESKFNSISNIGPNTALVNSSKSKLSKRKLDDLNVLNDFRKIYRDDGDNSKLVNDQDNNSDNSNSSNSNNNNNNNNNNNSSGSGKKKKVEVDDSDDDSNLDLTIEEKSQLSKERFEKFKLELKMEKYKEVLPDWQVREYPDKDRRIVFISPSDNRFYYFRHALNWNKENNHGKIVGNIDKYLEGFNKDLNKIISERRKEFNQDIKNEKLKAKKDSYLQKQSLKLDKKSNKSK